ncbi:MAG: hypothetical protein AAB383_04765 [Patescibacteria group bacterium]
MAKNPHIPEGNDPMPQRVPEAAREAENSRGIINLMGQIPTWARVAVASLVLGGTAAINEGCGFGEDPVDTAEDQILLSHQEKDWQFNMYRTGKAEVTEAHGKTLYHFIKGTLAAADVFEGMAEADQLKVIDAVIYFCRSLNPEDLDDFSGIHTKTLYFPESIHVLQPDGSTFLLDLDFDLASEKDEELKESLGDGGDVEITELNGKMDKMLKSLAKEYKRDPSQNVWPELLALDAVIDRASNASYHDIFERYNVASQSEMKAYKGETAAQIQDKLDELKKDRPANKKEIDQLEPILKTKIYNELVDIVKKMTPRQVEEKRILQGTVLDASFPFYNLQEVWEYKKRAKSQGADAGFYDIVIDELSDKSNSVTLESWLNEQEKACAYFNKHGAELGYDPQLAKYMTPSVVLAVMHAEFFSELSGDAFLDILPVAIESGNLPYGPAVGDIEVSMGEVQLLEDTFKLFLSGKSSQLRDIQTSDPSFKFLVPQKKDFTGKKKTVTRYDDQDLVAAMITDTPSHSFYTIMAIAYHIELGFNVLINDLNFKKAWTSAPESERYLFIASFSAGAINNGRGDPDHNNGAYGAATALLKSVDSTALNPYIQAIPTAAADSVPVFKLKKKGTVSRGAKKGAEAMEAMLRRASGMPERPVTVSEILTNKPRVDIFTAYEPLLDRAARDGFAFSTNVGENQEIYAAAKAAGVPVPMEGEGYRVKPYEGLDATLYSDALVIVQRFAAEFKARSGGYSLSIMDLMRSPEQQDAVSISKGTHPGGRTADVADGRFLDPAGNEITWSEKGSRGPHADLIEEKLRPVMIQLLEEYQARGFMMVFDETERGAIARGNTKSGGHWHVYIPTRAQGPVGPLLKP